MTSWPNIPKGLRKGMRTPGRRLGVDITGEPFGYGAIGKGRPAGARGPYPCKICALVYTPGHYAEHARTYYQ